jgi:hypothetical protein
VYSESRARALFEQSAAKGHRFGQVELLLCHERTAAEQRQGFTMIQHFADTASDADLYHMKAVCLHDGIGTVQDMPGALRCLEQAAQLGHGPALHALSEAYEYGFGVERDLAKARELYEKAAGAQHPGSQSNLACMLAWGEGGPVDKERALRLFEQAGKQRLPAAQFELGMMCWRTDGGPRSVDRAIEWLTHCAENPDTESDTKAAAMWYLHRIFSDDDQRGRRDAAKAREWLQRAANAGDPDALYKLGCHKLRGVGGFEKNDAAGRGLLQRAAAKGHDGAIRELRVLGASA